MNASARIKNEIVEYEYFTNPDNGVEIEIGEWQKYNNYNDECTDAERFNSYCINIRTVKNNYELRVSLHPNSFRTEYHAESVKASAGINIIDEPTSYISVNRFCHTNGWESLSMVFNPVNTQKLFKKIETLIRKFKEHADEYGGSRDEFKEKVAKLTDGIDSSMMEIRANDKIFKFHTGSSTVVVKETGTRWTIELPSFNDQELMAMLEGVKRYILLKRMQEV